MLEAGGNPMAKNDEAHFAAVLSVDVTEVTDKALERVRGAFATAVDHHNGTAAPEPADGLRAEFLGAADAIASALAMLDAVDDGNLEAEEVDEAEARAGIALGEVTTSKKAMVGPAVEVADGLRDLAVSGGLRIAASVYEQARGRTKNGFETLGEFSVAGQDIAVYGFDPDAEEIDESPRITFQKHARDFREHRREFRSYRRSDRRGASELAPRLVLCKLRRAGNPNLGSPMKSDGPVSTNPYAPLARRTLVPAAGGGITPWTPGPGLSDVRDRW